jgi:hypothetical protein
MNEQHRMDTANVTGQNLLTHSQIDIEELFDEKDGPNS